MNKFDFVPNIMERFLGCPAIAYVSQSCAESGTAEGYGLSKQIAAVRNCRGIGKKDMVLNDALPEITVDPETYEVTADGDNLICEPASELPLAQRYFLF